MPLNWFWKNCWIYWRGEDQIEDVVVSLVEVNKSKVSFGFVGYEVSKWIIFKRWDWRRQQRNRMYKGVFEMTLWKWGDEGEILQDRRRWVSKTDMAVDWGHPFLQKNKVDCWLAPSEIGDMLWYEPSVIDHAVDRCRLEEVLLSNETEQARQGWLEKNGCVW